ncbi:hypothetical protein BJF78_05590 [Pseudonocardia sp. CNS-139]|nr:hypothetical protein BJF78_05590 [Pseudonocardia sp. CNS-139]
MADTQQLPTPVPPEPPPPPSNRRRLLIVGAAVLVTAALVGVLTTVVTAPTAPTSVATGPGGTSAAQPGPAAPREQDDPLRPEGRSTLNPDDRSDTEAAVRYNWPLVADDEFDGSALDESHWDTYTGETSDDVGRHDPRNISVADGIMTITSHGKSSAGMAWEPGQLYGRWEVRARAEPGTGYSAVILLWPDAEDWPEGGEVNFMEIPNGARNETNFVLHWGEDNSQDGTTVPGDFTQWHNFAVEWTPDHVAGFIDGQEIWRSDNPDSIPPRPMHLAIQQDIGPFGNGWVPAPDATTPAQVRMQVDWVRIYGPEAPRESDRGPGVGQGPDAFPELTRRSHHEATS